MGETGEYFYRHMFQQPNSWCPVRWHVQQGKKELSQNAEPCIAESQSWLGDGTIERQEKSPCMLRSGVTLRLEKGKPKNLGGNERPFANL